MKKKRAKLTFRDFLAKADLALSLQWLMLCCLWCICDVTRSSSAGTILSLCYLFVCVHFTSCIQGLEWQPTSSSVIFRNHHLQPMRAPTQSGPPIKQRWGKDGVSTPSEVMGSVSASVLFFLSLLRRILMFGCWCLSFLKITLSKMKSCIECAINICSRPIAWGYNLVD